MGVSDFLKLDLPVLGSPSVQRDNAKPIPSILVKDEKKKSKAKKDETFRAAVWTRDGGKSRATGKPLNKSGMDPHAIGEVDHVIDRSLAPERIYDVSNGILLSKWENRAKKTPCPLAPEHRLFSVTGPDDRSKPQTFTWRDKHGTVIKTTKG